MQPEKQKSPTNGPKEKFAVSITRQSRNEIIEIAGQYPLLELRLDLMRVDLEELGALFQQNTLVVTFRSGHTSDERRMEALQQAMEMGAAYCDVDIANPPGFIREVRRLARNNGTRLIISSHDFVQTLPAQDLLAIAHRAVDAGADVVKLVTSVSQPGDFTQLVSLYKQWGYQAPLIAFGMGQAGKYSRFLPWQYHAPFTYAAPDETNLAANGQLSARQMEQAYLWFWT